MTEFDRLLEDALNTPFSGWDFAWARGRWHEADPPWNYRQLVQERIASTEALLDMGTGGGEFLASLPQRPPLTYATEGYPPNIPIALDRLTPLGVTVLPFDDDRHLPLADDAVELIINRHESYWLPEVCRVLRPGGTVLTQQVGPLDCVEINRFLGAPVPADVETWSLEQEVAAFEAAGFHVTHAEEALPDSIFYDVGAVVLFLRIIEWQIPDFSVEQYRGRLRTLHRRIEDEGAFHAHAHRFLIEAKG